MLVIIITQFFIQLKLLPRVDSVKHFYYAWVKPTDGNADQLFLLDCRALNIFVISVFATYSISANYSNSIQGLLQRLTCVSIVDIFTYVNPALDFLWYCSVTGVQVQEKLIITWIFLDLL